MDTFLASIMLWPVNFAPVGWLLCAGQLLSISQNSALFALLGTTYGGNGTTTFGLPDFRGRIPVGAGQGPALGNYNLGEMSGTETVQLAITEIPQHIHPVALTVTVSASSAQALTSTPAAGNSLAAPYDLGNAAPIAGYNSTAPNTLLNIGGGAINGNTGIAGGSLPHSNLQPYTVVNYIIATSGIFPSRP